MDEKRARRLDQQIRRYLRLKFEYGFFNIFLTYLNANISGSTDPLSIILGLLESPRSGLHGRKESSPIGLIGPEIFAFKVG